MYRCLEKVHEKLTFLFRIGISVNNFLMQDKVIPDVLRNVKISILMYKLSLHQ